MLIKTQIRPRIWEVYDWRCLPMILVKMPSMCSVNSTDIDFTIHYMSIILPLENYITSMINGRELWVFLSLFNSPSSPISLKINISYHIFICILLTYKLQKRGYIISEALSKWSKEKNRTRLVTELKAFRLLATRSLPLLHCGRRHWRK